MTAVDQAAIHFSPLDPACTDDPYSFYKRLIQDAPAYWNEDDEFWALSRYDDIAMALRDARTFSVCKGVTYADAGIDDIGLPVLSVFDPPEHTRLRAYMSKAFQPKAVANFELGFRQHMVEQLTWSGQRTLDVIDDLFFPWAIECSLDLLSIPAEDRGQWRVWMRTYLTRERGSIGFTPAGDVALVEAVDYLANLHLPRLRGSRGSFLSEIFNAEVDGGLMTDEEALGLMIMMSIVGAEDVTRTMGNLLINLGDGARVGEELRAQPAVAAAAIDETIRHDPSTQYMRRTTAADVEVHGQTIPSGARVLLLFGAANRDPCVFRDADTYDIHRHNARAAIGFSQGAHSCLGIHVARLQMQAGFSELLARTLDWSVEPSAGQLVHALNVSGYQNLPGTVALSG